MSLEHKYKIKNPDGFSQGYTSIVNAENSPESLMEFGILKLGEGQVFENAESRERVYVLLHGKVKLSFEGQEVTVERENIFDHKPWTLSVPKDTPVEIQGIATDSEFSVHVTENEKQFPAKLYKPEECRIEVRGKGQMNEAGTRLVRTIMDYGNAPHSNIMIGEDVQYPGKWAGFPSHSHNQPEIYFYRFEPKQGFGLLKLGDEGVCLEENDTVIIPTDLVHPQVAAPGYAMYFLWVIRHLEGNPYIKPDFEKQHLWVEEPDAKLWPER